MSNLLSAGILFQGGPYFPSSLMHEYDGSMTSSNTSAIWYDEIGSDNLAMTSTTYNTSTNGGVYTFNGSSSYGLGTNTKVPLTGGFSVMAWFRTGTDTTSNYFVNEYGPSSNDRVWILGRYLSGSNRVLRSTIYGEGTYTNNIDTFVLNLNTWYYIGFVYDPVANTLTNYANGVAKNSVSTAIDTVGTSSGGLVLGRITTASSTVYYPGDIGYVGIYDSPITSSQVLDTYNLTKDRFI